MRVIGTAGHVDHGKSTLVRRLTGIDPDRLKEEKQRQLTIDLGFAWLDLPNGETVGIVDVPGHRDFIENMLAGVGGIDAVVLVIAADEGVMPQTREHLAILDLLGIENGLVALTKTDLINDPDWLELVKLDIAEVLEGTSLADCPILPISAQDGSGIEELLGTLEQLLVNLPPNRNYRQPRLPVDRVFSVSGFGTVVTGTLSGGTLQIGDEIEFQPSEQYGRIRGLQSYQQEVETALPGSRVAVNVSGVDKQDVNRGDVLSYPGQLHSTILVDVYYEHLADASRPLKHNTDVKFFVGASETIAKVRLLDSEILSPGEHGWLQLRLRDELPLTQQDRFILRIPSPPETIGGGVIVNPHPGRRWKRFQADVIQHLETRLSGTPLQQIEQLALKMAIFSTDELQQASGFDREVLDNAFNEGLETNRFIELGNNQYVAVIIYEQLIDEIEATLVTFHQQYPLRIGMPREELRSRLNVDNNSLKLLLQRQDNIVLQDAHLKLADHQIQFTSEQLQQINHLRELFQENPFTPPTYTEATDVIGADVLHALIATGEFVQINADLLFTEPVYQQMIADTLALIDEHSAVSARQVRDHFDTSRKYAIAFLEYLDKLGVTKRVGDERVRGAKAPAV